MDNSAETLETINPTIALLENNKNLTWKSMEADYDVDTVIILLSRAPVLPLSEEFTSGIYEDRMYIYNACG